MIQKLMLDHPRSVGESYTAHFRMALGFAWTLFWASLACLVHALIPCLFKTTGSRAIAELHDRMVVNRQRRARQDTEETSAGPLHEAA